MQCTFMGTLISNKNKIKLWYFTFGLSFQILIIYLLMSNCLKVKCLLNMSEKPTEAFDLHQMFSKELQNKFWEKVYLIEELLKILVWIK